VLHLYLLDVTSEAARAALWERLADGYHRLGIRGFWLDADEPEIKPLHPDHLRYALGRARRSTTCTPCSRRGRCTTVSARPARPRCSPSTGRPGRGASVRCRVWSGDVEATFEALRAQLPAGLNIGLAGIPWWTTDTGGFKGGDPDDPAFRELLIRWAQFAVFCPIFRFHGLRATPALPGTLTDLADLADRAAGEAEEAFLLAGFSGGPNEVWSFGEEAYAILAGLLRLRERLRPTIHALMAEASAVGIPPMRALFLEFPDDDAAWDVADEFLLGPSILVAPVLEAGARSGSSTSRRARWRDGWTGVELQGGRRYRVPAPLDRVPVFLRDGAEVPLAG